MGNGTNPVVTDSFDGPALDPALWSQKQIKPQQFTFQPGGQDGGNAIVFAARENELLQDCANNEICQRLELREQKRVMFGDEVWYAFSFRVEGDIALTGSHRWVIGQWKEETEASPYVAQRFDDGIFHITIEDEGTRQLIATAKDTAAQVTAFNRMMCSLPPEQASRSVAAARMRHSINGRFNVSETLAAPATNTGLAERFCYINEPERYTGTARITLTPGEAPVLPDPSRGWVRMMYRIRGSTTGAGMVEVWANGRRVVTATGHIGHLAKDGPSQYFKIGQYRKAMPGTSLLWVDSFRRGPRREDVELGPMA